MMRHSLPVGGFRQKLKSTPLRGLHGSAHKVTSGYLSGFHDACSVFFGKVQSSPIGFPSHPQDQQWSRLCRIAQCPTPYGHGRNHVDSALLLLCRMRHKRRSCAKMCCAAGGELEQIQLLLGHASVQTTERYLGTRQDLAHAPNDGIKLKVAV
jgi:hypothetical protein